MLDWIYLIGWNQLIAATMGVVVWLICQTRVMQRRPALCHGLWLLVLIKLVTPPFLSIPMLPDLSAARATPQESAGQVTAQPPDQPLGSQQNAASMLNQSMECVAPAVALKY